MTRIHVICEGQTEEMFVKEMLPDIFISNNIELYPSLIGKPGHKGGNFKFERLLRDVKNRLFNDSKSYCTTLFDFYGLPSNFPGKKESVTLKTTEQKQDIIHKKIIEMLIPEIGTSAIKRFIPYVQMHEFEGLLFSEPSIIAKEIGNKNLATSFEKIKNAFDTPEHINDSPSTAPSKRIKEIFPQYEKVTYGTLIALEIGIEKILLECPLFNNWIEKLKSIESNG